MSDLSRYYFAVFIISVSIGCIDSDRSSTFCSTKNICLEIDTSIMHLELDTLRSIYDSPFRLRFVSSENKNVINILVCKNNETTEEDYFYVRPLLQYNILENFIARKEGFQFIRKEQFKINGSKSASVGYYYDSNSAAINTEIVLQDSIYMNIDMLFRSSKEDFDAFWLVNKRFISNLKGNKFKNIN